MAFLAPPPLLPRRRVPLQRHRPSMGLPACQTLRRNTMQWGLDIDPDDKFRRITALSKTPPLLRIENFVTDAECDALIAAQLDKTSEADLYLNYRVNREVRGGTSAEADALIAGTDGVRGLTASMRSGFRAQVEPDEPALGPVLRATRSALGLGGREFAFAEGAWVRPSRRRVVVRDQTTVRYEVGEGVAPHVDGKDVTVLVCLQEPDEGGRTVFPDEGLWVAPAKGCALVYRSKHELVHFAEAVAEGRKWVLQLLIDFAVREDEMDVDFATGAVLS